MLDFGNSKMQVETKHSNSKVVSNYIIYLLSVLDPLISNE